MPGKDVSDNNGPWQVRTHAQKYFLKLAKIRSGARNGQVREREREGGRVRVARATARCARGGAGGGGPPAAAARAEAEGAACSCFTNLCHEQTSGTRLDDSSSG